MGPHERRAREQAVEKLRKFLEQATPDDFATADDFADTLFEQIETAYQGAFESAAARRAVRTTTKLIYSFYRLKDETPFTDGSPLRLKFGAPDRRAIRFFDSLDNWYFSGFLDNTRADELKRFLKAEYLEQGAALFGRETPESLDDFRKAAGAKLKNINDRGVKIIAQQSVQRIRNWAHLGSLAQAEFEFCAYVATLDSRTTEICRSINGKRFRVGVAKRAVDKFTQLEPGEFALHLYESNVAKEYRRNPVAWIAQRTTDGIVDDDAITQGIGIPPLHINCRTRLRGVFPELGE
jgi:hypothetical protein